MIENYWAQETLSDSIYTDVDKPAEFPGGKAAMYRWLSENMCYPQEAIDHGIDGRCYVSFKIQFDGSVTNVKILRGVPDCPECDFEVKYAFSSMPKWNPQKENGKAVDSYWQLPIMFGLY